MVGSVSPAMKKRIAVPARWVVKNKARSLMGKEIDWCFDEQTAAPRSACHPTDRMVEEAS
jgi:hypothetical protein